MAMVISGSGTITGLVAGGLPDSTITSAELAPGAAVANIGTGGITSTELAPGAAVANIGTGGITSTELAAGAAVANIGTGGITSTQLAAGVQPIGVGQTWQNVTGSRTYGVTYTNTTGRPIFLGISMNQAGANRNPNFSLVVDGVIVGASSATSYAFNYQMSAIVPNGSTYLMNRTSGSVYAWAELR